MISDEELMKIEFEEHVANLYIKIAKLTKEADASLEDAIKNIQDTITELYDDTIKQTKKEFEDIFLSLLEELVKFKQCKIPHNKFADKIKALKKEIEALEKLTLHKTDLEQFLPKQPAYILAMLECLICQHFMRHRIRIVKHSFHLVTTAFQSQRVTYSCC